MLCPAFRSADSQEQPIVGVERPFSRARSVVLEVLLMLSNPPPVTNSELIPNPGTSVIRPAAPLSADFIKHSGMTFCSEPQAEAKSGAGRLRLGIRGSQRERSISKDREDSQIMPC